jgi:hypothetical protein
VSLDYHSANRKPQSHPARLGRNERIENHACFARVDARPSVLDRQDNCITVQATGAYLEKSTIIIHGGQRLNRVTASLRSCDIDDLTGDRERDNSPGNSSR